MDFIEFSSSISDQCLELVTQLHNIAVENGCKYKIEQNGETSFKINYSAKHFTIDIKDETVSFFGVYDIRAFLKLFRETQDEALKKMLFEAAISCDYCIGDKCTTLLMADERTIEFQGNNKKLCAVCFHPKRWVNITVNPNNLSEYKSIVEMIFEYTYPHSHTDLLNDNKVTYSITEMNDFYIVGYLAKHNQLSQSDEEFAASILSKSEDGKRKIDAVLDAVGQIDCGKYAGATVNFVNGVQYDFIFGVITEVKSQNLPENVVCRKIRSGQWAVYNSSSNDYKSIWKHFTQSFYNEKQMGYDVSRVPFEYYDENGKFFDVHIPVDPDMPVDSGRIVTLMHMPNAQIAGTMNFVETDYPLHTDTHIDLKPLFPYADKFVCCDIHSIFGKPHRFIDAVFIDDYTVIPEGIETFELKGGYWRLEGRCHFNGETSNFPFDVPLNSKVNVFDCQHPRAFIDMKYVSRGGYNEIGIPARMNGDRVYEAVELKPQRVIGKLEAPPQNIVTDKEMQSLYTLDVNNDKGSYVIGYTMKIVNDTLYHDKPLVKGVFADDNTVIPDRYECFTLDSGRYMKVTESLPNGEPGWEIEFVKGDFEKESGFKPDLSKQIIIHQCDYGKYYEMYVPVL